MTKSDYRSVSVPKANIRSGPGTGYAVLWKVEKYHPLKIINQSGPWYQFRDYENDTGWIHSDLVDDIRTVIVTASDCNVRSGPALTHEIIFKVDVAVPFRVLDQKGEWLSIQHSDGDKGWIHRNLVWPK